MIFSKSTSGHGVKAIAYTVMVFSLFTDSHSLTAKKGISRESFRIRFQ